MPLTKGTLTNQIKLASWDIDYYLSLSDEECSVCLTQKELYLLRNPLAQMVWLTRWQTQQGTPLPDIENISERLAYKLDPKNCCEVDYCAEIVDCIETSESVQLALNKRIVERGTDTVPDDNPQMTMDVFDTGCDLNVTFGQVSAVWTLINQNTIDFLQILSAAGNPSELGSKIVSAIPVLGLLPIDEFLSFAGKFGEWTLDTYEAFLTVSLEDSIKCDLFCLAIEEENCTLTTAQLINYFASRVGALADVKVQTLEDFINFMISLPTNVAVAFVCSMALTQLYIVSIFEKFLGFNSINAYIAYARLGDPSDDWQLLCDECGELWFYTSDFPVEQNGWIPNIRYASIPLASYATTTGWSSVDAQAGVAQYWRGTEIKVIFASPVFVSSILMTFDLTKGSFVVDSTSYRINTFLSGAGNGTIVVNNSAAVNGNGQTVLLEPNKEIDEIQLLVRSSLQSTASYSGANKIVQVEIIGTGTKPTELE